MITRLSMMSRNLRLSIVMQGLRLALLVVGLLVPHLHAADPTSESIEFDRIDIPADQPSTWPKEIDRFDDYPRNDFLALIRQISERDRRPRLTSLKSAHYEATLVNDTLRSGLMTASVQRLANRPTLFELGTYSFALEELKWQKQPAIWGSSADGRTWLLTNENNDVLLGEWSCRGRKIPGGIDFDLQLPQATISFLDLRAPANFTVSAPTADVSVLSDNPADRTRLWRIHCGSDNQCRVTFVSNEGLEPSRRALIVEHDMEVVVREDDLRFQLNLRLEALDAPVPEITLNVPAGLEIYSAVYGGDIDNPVTVRKASESEVNARWIIQLPGPLGGRRRTLRIDGIAVQKPGAPSMVPQIVVENSVFDGGNLLLTVQSPLEVRSMRASGYRQRATTGDQYSFQQLTTNAKLILDVQRTQVSLSGQLLSVLSVEEDHWDLTTEMIWKSLKGGGFQTSCLIPMDWDVTDVRLKEDSESRRTASPADVAASPPLDLPKMNWEIQTRDLREKKLAIEFLEAIQPGQSRSVIVSARRVPPTLGQSVPIPIPQLLNCEISEVYLGVQTPASMTALLSADSRLERHVEPGTSVFEIPREKPGFERRWYRSTSTDNAGTLQLSPRLQPVHVRMKTVIEALPSEYRMKYTIESEGAQAQVERLLVYLTESNSDIRWIWKDAPNVELSAVRIANSQHAEWKLPATGELWELRWPRALGPRIAIEGNSTNRWTVDDQPALAYLPQAIEKLSECNIIQAESVELNVDSDGLKPVGPPMSWWYATPQARLAIGLRNPLPSREFPLMVSIELRTLMTSDANGSDLYRARIRLENGSASESLRIKLDSMAVVQEATVGGESIAAGIQGGEFVIPGLNAVHRDLVEISYRVPVRSRFLREQRQIVIPEVSAKVLGFFWDFGIPPAACIFAEPRGVHLSRPLPSPAWNERLFGPLGRSTKEVLFNPFQKESWSELLNPRPAMETSVSDPSGDLVALHHASAADVPAELTIELWQRERIQLLIWITCGLFLLCGMLMRIVNWPHRDRLAAGVLGVSLAIAFLVPAPYASFFGASIAGTVVALLIPHQLIRTSSTMDQAQIKTRIVRGALATLVVGGLTFLGLTFLSAGRSLAQDDFVDENLTRRPRVYVPVDKDGQPSETVRLVYVPHETLERWKNIASERSTVPSYLISSAHYELSGTSATNLSLVSKFRIHVLSPVRGPVVVFLPLSGTSLPDAGSCLVNGLPTPIGTVPGGQGYSLELPPPANFEAGAAAKEQGNELSEDAIVTYEVELQTRKPRPTVPQADFRIPVVANSEFILSTSEPTTDYDIIGGRGSVDRKSATNTVVSQLGSTVSIQVRWGPPATARKVARLSISMLQDLELRPSCAELNFHLLATILEGRVDAIEFDLPPGAIVRKDQLRTEGLLRSDLIQTKEGQRRLRLIFDAPRQMPFTVDGVLIIPQDDLQMQTPLPRFGIARSDWLDLRYDRNWWGVSTSADFVLDHSTLDHENVIPVSPDEYLAAWLSAVDTRRHESFIPGQPQLCFELREGTPPVFTIAPHQPRRKATQWKQTGLISRNRLDWTLESEIESVHVPVFQTSLLVDRRLRIEEISVKENNAERRTRWTESKGDPSRVVLFLSDRTQGKQSIRLQGSLPLTSGAPVDLPFVLPEDCEVENLRLVLKRSADVPEADVSLTDIRDWKVLPNEEPVAANQRADSFVTVGTYQLTQPDDHGAIQVSSRHSRCSSRAAAWLRRIDDGAVWQLKYRLELTPEGELPLRLALSFPATFTDIDSVMVDRAEKEWQNLRDGSRQLDLLLNRGDGTGNVVVQFELTLTEPAQQDWELPLPSIVNSTNHETVIVIEPETIWFPREGREVRMEGRGDWLSGFFEDLPSAAVLFRVAEPSVSLQRNIVSTDVRKPLIRLLDQRMWLHSGGRRSGIAQVFVSSVRGEVQFELPAGANVSSIFLDDHPLALPTPTDGRLKVSLADAANEALLTLAWDVEGAPAGLWTVSTNLMLRSLNVPVERNVVTIIPDEPTTLVTKSGLDWIGPVDQGLDELETLLDRHAALGTETRVSIANRWMIDQTQRRLKDRLPVEVRQRGDQVEGILRRWTGLVSRINQLERVPAAPPVSWHSRLFEEPVADAEFIIRGRAKPEGNLQVWQFDWHVLNTIAAVMLALILIPMLRQTIRIEWSAWLRQHVELSWLILAIFWWLFLTPSFLGPCLLTVSLIKWITSYKPARTA